MTLTIITGTHSFIDLTGKFRRAFIASMSNRIKYTINGLTFTKRRFDRVEITKEGKVIHEPSRLVSSNYFYCDNVRHNRMY